MLPKEIHDKLVVSKNFTLLKTKTGSDTLLEACTCFSFKYNVRFLLSSYLHIGSLRRVEARYLGSAVAVTPFVLSKHTVVEERYP